MDELLLPLKELGLKLIKGDLLYGKLDTGQEEELVDFALSMGREQAEISLEQGLNRLLPAAYIKQYCQLEYRKQASIPIYSEIEIKHNRIILYQQEIDEVGQELEQDREIKGVINKKRLYNIFLLHEFFHYLEFNELGPVSSMKRVPVIKIFSLAIKRGLLSLSEIAAHAYAREITGDPITYITEGEGA